MINHDDALPALSVTCNLHHEYVALASALKVMVLSHEIAVVVALLHDQL